MRPTFIYQKSDISSFVSKPLIFFGLGLCLCFLLFFQFVCFLFRLFFCFYCRNEIYQLEDTVEMNRKENVTIQPSATAKRF